MPRKRVSLSIGAREFLKEKLKYICILLFDPEDIKILSLEAIWNFDKGTGLS
jgi:hypothetical protein